MSRIFNRINGFRAYLLVDWQMQNGPESVRQHHVIPGLTTIKEWLVPYVSRTLSPVAVGRQI